VKLRYLADRKRQRDNSLGVSGYYNSSSAAEVLAILLKVLKEPGKTLIIPWSEFKRLSVTSVFIKITSGWNYLIDKCEPEDSDIFLQLRARYSVKRKPDGIHLAPRYFHARAKAPACLLMDPTNVATESEAAWQTWQDDLEKFFNNAKSNDMYIKKELALSGDRFEQISTALPEIFGEAGTAFQWKLTLSTFKIIKL
jgi:hypothetical protein